MTLQLGAVSMCTAKRKLVHQLDMTSCSPIFRGMCGSEGLEAAGWRRRAQLVAALL